MILVDKALVDKAILKKTVWPRRSYRLLSIYNRPVHYSYFPRIVSCFHEDHTVATLRDHPNIMSSTPPLATSPSRPSPVRKYSTAQDCPSPNKRPTSPHTPRPSFGFLKKTLNRFSIIEEESEDRSISGALASSLTWAALPSGVQLKPAVSPNAQVRYSARLLISILIRLIDLIQITSQP